MKKFAYIVGVFTLTLVSCKKESIQPNAEVQEVHELERRVGIIGTNTSSDTTSSFNNIGPINGSNSNDNSTSTPDSTGGITDPNDDDYSTRKPGKTKK